MRERSVTRRSTFAALAKGHRVRHGPVHVRFIDAGHPDMQPGTTLAVAFAFPRAFGNAVARNRAKRRLRAAFADAGGHAFTGAFLMSASRGVLHRSYADLVDDVRSCLVATSDASSPSESSTAR